MKTSKEIQLKMIEKVKENIENGRHIYSGIQVRSPVTHNWVKLENLTSLAFSEYEFRFEPETVTVNGVEIPKPVAKEDWQHVLFEPNSRKSMYRDVYQDSFHLYDDGALLYADVEQAIEASKALFGIEG